jgi:catechol 2,3-dioxygenase-like lactoylglutathione lyase family enzyme
LQQSLALVALLVRDYDEALAFFVGDLGFVLVEDTFMPQQNKRWVVIAPPASSGTRILLARASTPEQTARLGDQSAGRVFLFLHTDIRRDYARYRTKGVEFVRPLTEEPWGQVAVFRDLYGNLWDLIQPGPSA